MILYDNITDTCMVGMVTFGQKRYPAIEGQKINFDMMIIGEKTGGWSTHRTEQRFLFFFIHLKKKSKFVKFLSYAIPLKKVVKKRKKT